MTSQNDLINKWNVFNHIEGEKLEDLISRLIKLRDDMMEVGFQGSTGNLNMRLLN